MIRPQVLRDQREKRFGLVARKWSHYYNIGLLILLMLGFLCFFFLCSTFAGGGSPNLLARIQKQNHWKNYEKQDHQTGRSPKCFF